MATVPSGYIYNKDIVLGGGSGSKLTVKLYYYPDGMTILDYPSGVTDGAFYWGRASKNFSTTAISGNHSKTHQMFTANLENKYGTVVVFSPTFGYNNYDSYDNYDFITLNTNYTDDFESKIYYGGFDDNLTSNSNGHCSIKFSTIGFYNVYHSSHAIYNNVPVIASGVQIKNFKVEKGDDGKFYIPIYLGDYQSLYDVNSSSYTQYARGSDYYINITEDMAGLTLGLTQKIPESSGTLPVYNSTADYTPLKYKFKFNNYNKPVITRDGFTFIIKTNYKVNEGIRVYRNGVYLETIKSESSTAYYEIPDNYKIGEASWVFETVSDTKVYDLNSTCTYRLLKGYTDKIVENYDITGSVNIGNVKSDPLTVKIVLTDPDLILNSKINKITAKWSSVKYANSYRINIDSSESVDLADNVFEYTFNNVSLGDHLVTITAVSNAGDEYSSYTTKSITTVKIPMVRTLNFVQNSEILNQGTLIWTSSTPDTGDLIYKYYLNDAYVGETNDLSAVISNIPYRTNTEFSVVQAFIPDSDYDSTPIKISIAMKRLPVPVLSKQDIMGNIIINLEGVSYYLVDGKLVKVSEYKTGNIKQGVVAVRFNFSSSDSGNPFDIYTKYEDEEYQYAFSSADNYYQMTISNRGAYGTAGKHYMKIKQVYKADQDYSSPEFSNEVSWDIATLNKVAATWDTRTGVYQSRARWLPVSTQDEQNYADFYIVQATADNNPAIPAFTVLQGSDLSDELGCWIPSLDPIGNAGVISDDNIAIIKDSNRARHMTSFTINIRALSFNSFYIGGSEQSVLNYNVIKLAAPNNLSWDSNTETLSWSVVDDANIYYIKRNGAKIGESTTASYKLDYVEPGLQYFEVSALKITEEG